MPQTIDKKWFLKLLDERQISVRGLARHMDLDASAVSRMLSGQRKWLTLQGSNLGHSHSKCDVLPTELSAKKKAPGREEDAGRFCRVSWE